MTYIYLALLGLVLLSCGPSGGSSDSNSSEPATSGSTTDPTNTTTFDPSTVGTLVIDQITTGQISGADLPTVNFDIVKDVSSVVLDPSQYIGVLQISSSGLRLQGPDSYTITSSLGGSVQLKDAEVSEDRLKGVLEPSAFLARQGFPTFDEGSMTFDLATTDSSIDGDVTLKKGKIGDITDLGLEAVYKLYKENSLWRGKMTGKLFQGQGSQSFEYDYDTPILTQLEVVPLDGSSHETTGTLVNGGSVRVKLSVNSNAPVNWLNISWDSPISNLLGGGNGVNYLSLGQCSATAFAQSSSTFCEHSRGFWTLWQDYTVNSYQPSGTYTFQFSVKNAAMLTSRTLKTTFEVQNSNSSSAKPVIEQVNLDAPATLGTGNGGTVTLHILASSTVPVNWLTLSLHGPTSNVFGGGSGTSFQECSSYMSGAPALCGSHGAGYWYLAYTYTVSQYGENGSYQFDTISVANASNVTSNAYGSVPSFVVAGNTVATTPTIASGAVFRVSNYGDNPLTTGTLITGTCLVASSQPDPLVVALVLDVNNSNVAVNWLNRSFEGPTSNLEGGGSAPSSATDLGSGSYRVVQYNSIASPNFAPKGLYYYQNLSVTNAGNKTSSTFGGTSLGFQLKTTCP